MRIVTVLLILIICFGIGVLFGLMYDSPQEQLDSSSKVEIETKAVENASEENIEVNEQIVSIPLDEIETHPIEKVANVSEKVTNSFFEKVVKILASISDALL